MSLATAVSLNPLLNLVSAWKGKLQSELVERDEQIHLFALALAASESMLLLGPPGIAKTMTVDRGAAYIGNVRYFYVQLGALSTLEEPYGPLSMDGIMRDQYRRVTRWQDDDGDWHDSLWSQNSHICLWDEAYKASVPLTTSGLQLMNQRTFNDNGHPLPAPLSTFIVCSNEERQSEEQEAFDDRLVIRDVLERPHDRGSIIRMLQTELDPNPRPVIDWADWLQIQQQVKAMPVPMSTLEMLVDLERDLLGVGISITPRRLVKAKRIAQAEAWLDGAAQVETEHLSILQHVAWLKADDRILAQKTVLSRTSPVQQAALELLQKIENLGVGVDEMLDAAAKQIDPDTNQPGVPADANEITEFQKKLTQANRAIKSSEALVGTSLRQRELIERCRRRHGEITHRLLTEGMQMSAESIRAMLNGAA